MQDIAKTFSQIGSSFKEWIEGIRENAGDLGLANRTLALNLIADGRIGEAIFRLKIAQKFHANDANIHYLLGRCYLIKGNATLAVQHLKHAITLNPSHEEARFVLAAPDATVAQDLLPHTYPVSLVQEYFGAIAADFEALQINELGYRGHIAIATLMNKHLPKADASRRVLDVGCGTGLVGDYLFSHARVLVGVDVTPEMSELAFIRSDEFENTLYNEVETMDARDYLLSAHDEPFDIIAASYSVNYMGGLSALFDGVKKSLSPEGWFVFTTDVCDGSHYQFMQTLQRFAHSEPYIRQQAQRVGLSVVAIEPVTVFEGVESIGVVCRNGH